MLSIALIVMGISGCTSDSNLTAPVGEEIMPSLAALAEMPADLMFQRGEVMNDEAVEALIANHDAGAARAAGIVGVWKVNEKYLQPAAYKNKRAKGYYIFEGTAAKGRCTVATKIIGTRIWYVAEYYYKVVGQKLSIARSYTEGDVSSRVSQGKFI